MTKLNIILPDYEMTNCEKMEIINRAIDLSKNLKCLEINNNDVEIKVDCNIDLNEFDIISKEKNMSVEIVNAFECVGNDKFALQCLNWGIEDIKEKYKIGLKYSMYKSLGNSCYYYREV